MKTNGSRGFTVLAGALAVTALALGCGGGGGGTPGRINGALSKSSQVRTASLGSARSLFARAGAWLGVGQAVAAGASGQSGCGNPLDPAAGVPVKLLLNGAVVQTTVTDSGGNFRFADLAAGDYVIQVTLPSGTISAPTIVRPAQTTAITGSLDVDCKDVNGNGDKSEPALHVESDTDDGSMEVADETESGGKFHGDVHEDNGSVKHEDGTMGDRSDEHDTHTDETQPKP